MKTIKAYVLALLSILIGSGAVLVLVPMTLLCVFGAAAFISFGVFGVIISLTGEGGILVFLGIAKELLEKVFLPGYSLVSLWWMVLEHRSATLRDVSKGIWLGLAIGCVYAALFAGVHRFRLKVSPPFIAYENLWGDLTMELYLGVAPLLILLCALLSMWLRGRWDASSQSSSSGVQVGNP
ncbi:MAG: hypothetical protein Q4A28_09360 [Brachymonas sp.]|nr:hypothetical protein [Brachymonas sp.]